MLTYTNFIPIVERKAPGKEDGMLLKIEKSSPIPFYQQIIDVIKILIDQGSLEVDQKLPSTRSLAKKLGVNRSTVVKAYEELQALGYLYSRPGSYNKVQKRRKEVEYNPDRESAISWEKASNPSGQRVYKIFGRYSPEKPRLSNSETDALNISELDLDPRLYPLHEFRRCVNHVLWERGSESLQYGDHKGYPPLRRQIARRLRLHSISVSEDEILITNGAQQAIDLIIRMLTRPKHKVAVESPTYANIIPLLHFAGVKILPIPMKTDGMDLSALARLLKNEKISFIYTIPNFQNPTGITTSHQHREQLLNLSLAHGVPLVEDGFEEDMKYFGKVPLPIKSIDDKNMVVYLGTFSKALFPGLRIGWVTADNECINRLTAIKRFSDLSSGSLVQIILHEFLKRGYYDLQLKRLHRIYRKRMQLALKTIEDWFPRSVNWTRPTGGYTIWVRMPWKLEEDQLHKELLKHGVVVSSGRYYFPQRKPSEYFRISIAKRNLEEIREGITRLGQALHGLEKRMEKCS
jgi:GntR family transcriptional regulator/MocR family aminotransferase